MQLKITTDYAIRMILYLAQNESVIVSATDIAQAMKIPHSYLIQIGAVLKKSGLIQAHSGRLGGYSLAEPSDSITLYDIVAVHPISGASKVTSLRLNISSRMPAWTA